MDPYCHHTPAKAFPSSTSSTTEVFWLSNTRSQACSQERVYIKASRQHNFINWHKIGTSNSWLFCLHQLLLPFPLRYALGNVGKVTYLLLPGPEKCGIVSTTHDGLARNSHVKITVSHTRGHTSAERSRTAHPQQTPVKEKAGEPCRETQSHTYVKGQTHSSVTGMEGPHPLKHITHLRKPMGV